MSYYPNIPAASDDPSDSQGEIQTNFSTINNAFSLNHVSLGTGTGLAGKHNFVEMPNQAVDPTTISGEGCLYTKSVSDHSSSGSQLFYCRDGSNNSFQLTRTISDTFFSKLGTNTNYQVGSPSVTGGWSFLPGGMMIQYGLATAIGSSGSVNFPVGFSTGCYSVVVTAIRNSTNVDVIYDSATASTTGFTYRNTSSGGITSFYWIAMGV